MAEVNTTILLVLLTLLLNCSLAAVQFWNIDCGAKEGFTDTLTGLTWVGEGDYVRAGESHQIQNASDFKTEYATLRAFPKNKKNCYTITVGINVKIRVAVSFFYGNYDGKAKPPSFSLIFDGNFWDNVETAVDRPQAYSVIYVTKRNSTSVCVGRVNDDQDPFITILQVFRLKTEMYSKVNSSYALYTIRSVAFVLNDTLIRYPDDHYDRSWYPSLDFLEGFNYSTLKSIYPTVNTNTSNDDPPTKMFAGAAAPLGGTENLTIAASYLASVATHAYFSMYFTEVSKNVNRSFDIYMDDKLISNDSHPIIPPIGRVLEFSYTTRNATNNTVFTLVPSKNSSLPPIISGWQVSLVSVSLNDVTQINDAKELSKLQDNFKVLQAWSGDPCLPLNYSWEWVACNYSDDSPRITRLYLSGYELEGRLPDFSKLDALEVIDLHNNSLSGRIPGFLGELPNLQELNLAYNNFSSIPPSLSNNTRIILNITGNPQLDKASMPPTAASPPLSSEPATPPPSDGHKVQSPCSLFYLLLLVIAGIA